MNVGQILPLHAYVELRISEKQPNSRRQLNSVNYTSHTTYV